MAQGYKHDTMPLYILCEHIYHAFGQFAVINFIRDRQNEGYLSDVDWKDCNGCDWHTPNYLGVCLVCGSH